MIKQSTIDKYLKENNLENKYEISPIDNIKAELKYLPCEHKREINFSNFKYKGSYRECKVCKKNERERLKKEREAKKELKLIKVNKEKLEEYFKENNLEGYTILDIRTRKDPITLQHNCGHTYSSKIMEGIYKGGGRCPMCRRRNEVQEWLKENNLEEEYEITVEDTLKNVEIKHNCGNKCEISWYDFKKRVHKCAECNVKKIVQDWLKENKLENEYEITTKDTLNNIEVKYLKCGHKEIVPDFDRFKKGSYRECPKCRNKRIKLNKYILKNKIQGYKIASILNKDQVVIEHNCGNKYKVYWSNFTRGTGRCKVCKK